MIDKNVDAQDEGIRRGHLFDEVRKMFPAGTPISRINEIVDIAHLEVERALVVRDVRFLTANVLGARALLRDILTIGTRLRWGDLADGVDYAIRKRHIGDLASDLAREAASRRRMIDKDMQSADIAPSKKAKNGKTNV